MSSLIEPILTVTDTIDPGAREVISAGLGRFNVDKSGIDDWQALDVLASDPQTHQVVGGLTGRTSLGLLFIDVFFLPENLRGSGVGSRILRLAEEEATRRGCRAAVLYTISFQAPGFYERNGYHTFGKVDSHLAGVSRVFMTKTLVSDHISDSESAEVSWPLDSTTVYGTLVKPAGPGPFPAVVMVAGSGPTDRDWNSPLLPGTNGSARLLAESLARAGIASLRYDKRAAGPHARENMQVLIGKLSMQSHLDELAGAVRTIASRDSIREDKLFALTNSEGALHALNYQVSSPEIPFAGLVLTAPPGRTVGAVGRSQVAAQVAGIPKSEAVMSAYDAAIAHFIAAEPFRPDPSLPQAVQTLLQALVSPANLPFARELWLADAAALLEQIQLPVLIVIGKKDIQVDWQADGEPLQRAAAGKQDVTFVFPENANHVQKYEPKNRADLVPFEVASGYNAADARLDDEAQAAILEWLAGHT